MKKFTTILIIMLSVLIISCSNTNKVVEERNVTMILPDGLPSIAISKAINDKEKVENINIEYLIQKTPDLLLAELMKGEAELAIIPSNLALQAYKKGLDYKIAATIGWGSFYLVADENITTIEELKGKEVYNTGKGLTPDIIFKEILASNDLYDTDLTLSYVGSAAELSPLVVTGKAKYAVVPEPALSTVLSKNPDLKVLLNLNEEWSKLKDTKEGYPQSTLVIKESFYNEIKDNGAYDKLLEVINNAEEYTQSNPQEVAKICETIGITVNKEVIDSSIKNSNIKFTPIEHCIDEYEIYFKTIDKDNKGENNEYKSLFIER